MKKKYFFSFLFFILLAGLWSTSRSRSLPSRPAHAFVEDNQGEAHSAARVLANDKRRLESNLRPDVVEDKNWALVNDYSLEVKQLLNKDNAFSLFFLNQKSARDLSSCLKKDFCGMQRRNEDDAYFDEARTPAHVLLGRNLEIMLEAMKLSQDLKKQVDWDLVTQLTENENEKVQLMALDLLEQRPGAGGTAKLLELADHYKGTAKAEAFVRIVNHNQEGDRGALVEWLLKSFAQDDPHSVISIIERMKNMTFSSVEIERLSLGLCHFKEEGSDDPNWKMIRYYMSGLIDLEKICN